MASMSSPCSRNKRKREPSEPESSSCESPSSTVSFASLHDKGKDRLLLEEEESGRYSPRTSVARSLKDLAIYDSSSHDEDADSGKSAVQWRVGFIPPSTGGETAQQGAGSGASDSATVERKKKKPISVSRKVAMFRQNRRRLSPPPPDPESCSESDTTVFNSADPNEDDGYGINGIGFKPTPAIAWARAQKRQRQIAEWKKREAREARERRLERRHGGAHAAAAAARALSDGSAQKRVKFALDG